LTRGAALEGRGPYIIQAEISAAHVVASLEGWPASRRWRRVAALYAELETALPSPVVRLNRAVAVGRSGDPEAGLRLLEEPLDDVALRSRFETYQPYHAARADLLRLLGRTEDARGACARAIELARARKSGAS